MNHSLKVFKPQPLKGLNLQSLYLKSLIKSENFQIGIEA